MAPLTQFLHMGGYAFYVWSAYGMVLTLMTIQWYLAREKPHE